MMLNALTRDQILGLTQTKHAWTGAEVRSVVSTMKSVKNLFPTKLKEGDIVYHLGHPCIIFRIKGELAYIALLTTEETCAANLGTYASRFISGNYTSTITVVKTASVVDKFCGILDDRKKLWEIKRNLKAHYLNLFKK